MERGGWSTDSTMKKVYTHTFSKERIDVDNRIDNYFNATLHVAASGLGSVSSILANMTDTERSLCLVDSDSRLLSVAKYLGANVIEKYDICDRTHFSEPTLRTILKI